MEAIFCIALAFALGAAPFGLIVAKIFRGVDPRHSGSGNVGATNVARLCGWPFGVLTLVLDILKGTLPVALAGSFGLSTLAVSLTALAAVLGHAYSPFLGFKGGKAVATTIGAFIPIAFWQLAPSAGLCIAAIILTGFVSIGSLVLVTALPLFLLFAGKYGFLPLALAIMLLVYWRHRENIQRLARGEEKPWIKNKSAS